MNLIGGKGVVHYECRQMHVLCKMICDRVQIVAISVGNHLQKHKILVYDVVYDVIEYKL